MSAIESVLVENRVFPPPAAFTAQANVKPADFEAMKAKAERDHAGFWADLARENLIWSKPFTKSLDDSNAPFFKWFSDGELNASYNCLDRHLNTPVADKTAIIFEADGGDVTKVTYRDLYKRVCRFANGLKSLGYKKGDRAIIYLPMSIEAVVAMQACARIGMTHSVVFGGFSAKSLQERIVDVGATLVIAADEQMRGGKAIPLKPAVDEAYGMGGCDAVRHTIVYKRTGGNVAYGAKDIDWAKVEAGQADDCPAEMVNAEHPLFVLYTSGSTGKPKGVQHSTGGYLLHAMLTMKWTFDIKPNDVFWCTADVGWVTGHTYVTYGPLAVGATEIIFEGVPTFPNAGRFWDMIQKHKCTVFYTAPTAIRSLIKAADTTPDFAPGKYDLSSLRLLGSVGEPINPEAWMWYYKNIGGERCPIVDTFWQTETGGHMITPLPGVTPLVPGSCTQALPGIAAAIVDETANDVPNGSGGILVVKKPWPSMIRTIWGDPERFKKSYFPDELKGYYLAGDGALTTLVGSRILDHAPDLGTAGLAHGVDPMAPDPILDALLRDHVRERDLLDHPFQVQQEGHVRLGNTHPVHLVSIRLARQIEGGLCRPEANLHRFPIHIGSGRAKLMRPKARERRSWRSSSPAVGSSTSPCCSPAWRRSC